MLTRPAPPEAPSVATPPQVASPTRPSRRSSERVQALATRRPTRVNLCTAVVLASLGLMAVRGQMGAETGFGTAFSVGRVATPAALGEALQAASGAVTGPAGAATATAPAVAIKAMPTGKGMWIYEFPRTEGGNMDAIVAKAKATGITHVYPRMGSHWDGFNARKYLDAFLPKAHAAGPARLRLGLPPPGRLPPVRHRAGPHHDQLHQPQRRPPRRLLGRHRDDQRGQPRLPRHRHRLRQGPPGDRRTRLHPHRHRPPALAPEPARPTPTARSWRASTPSPP